MAPIGIFQYFILFTLFTHRLAYDSTVNGTNTMKLLNHSEGYWPHWDGEDGTTWNRGSESYP